MIILVSNDIDTKYSILYLGLPKKYRCFRDVWMILKPFDTAHLTTWNKQLHGCSTLFSMKLASLRWNPFKHKQLFAFLHKILENKPRRMLNVGKYCSRIGSLGKTHGTCTFAMHSFKYTYIFVTSISCLSMLSCLNKVIHYATSLQKIKLHHH